MIDTSNEIKFEDHFSLGNTLSSTVKFRGSKVHVYDTPNEQLLLEESPSDDGRPKLKVKRMESGYFGAQCLRLFYTLVSCLAIGVIFVVNFQILLFVFLNLPASVGLTSGSKLNIGELMGPLLSIPTFVYGMASMMSLGSIFVTDTWGGNHFLRSLIGLPGAVTEILYFMMFLFIPALSFIYYVFTRDDYPWKDTCIIWFWCAEISFAVFALSVIYREVTTCLLLVRNNNCSGNENVFYYLAASVYLSIVWYNSGTRMERYLVSGDDEPEEGYALNPLYKPTKTHQSFYATLTELGCCFCFKKLDPPIRLYSSDEIRDVMPYVTGNNWSLEGLFMRRNVRFLAATSGKAALTKEQVRYSLLCNTFGSVLLLLLFVGVLVWLEAGKLLYFLSAIIYILCFLYPAVKNSFYVYSSVCEINQENLEASLQDCRKEEKDCLFQVREKVRITEPTVWYCILRFASDIILLYLYPLFTMFVQKNYPVACAFLIIGLLSYVRKYLDTKAILSELGSINDLKVNESKKDLLQSVRSSINVYMKKPLSAEDQTLLSKYQLSELVGKARKKDSLYRWMWVFGLFGFVVLFLFLQGMASDDLKPGERPPIDLVEDFYYPPQPDLPYPSCEMTKGFKLPNGESTALLNYAFMSALAYEMPNVTQEKLDIWFGPGKVTDESEFVESIRSDNAPVYFKLFALNDFPGSCVIAIRGSETSWDWLVNMQLWSSAALTQVLKWSIPYGWIWHPIMDYIVNIIHFIESDSLANVAYYIHITNFIDKIEKGFQYDNIKITGASLGGGLAIITGAQTKKPAVAISGLGAVLIKDSIIPPVTVDELNSHVFNWIPDRDYIARIGGRSRLFQEANCTAQSNSFFGCHSMWRSVCELSYRCGSGGHPVFCRCVQRFGYPEPVQNGTRTFDEACPPI